MSDSVEPTVLIPLGYLPEPGTMVSNGKREKKVGEPLRDSIALLLDHILQHHRKRKDRKPMPWIALSQKVGKSVCGKPNWRFAREYLVSTGAICLYREWKRLKNPNLYKVRIPSGTTLTHYGLQTSNGRKRLVRHQKQARKVRLPKGYHPNAEQLVSVAQAQVDHLMSVDIPTNEEALAQRLSKATVSDRWIIRAQEKNWRPTMDKQGRLYTPFTQMKKADRGFFLFGEETTYKVDIRNCTPLILAGRAAFQRQMDRQYVEDCQTGQLYEAFTDEATDRKMAKGVMQWFHNRDRRFKPTDEEKQKYLDRFQARYPTMYAWMESKRLFEAKDGLYELAVPPEAQIVLTVVADLIEDGIQAASVHDCILCPESKVGTVQDRLREAFHVVVSDKMTPAFDVKPLVVPSCA